MSLYLGSKLLSGVATDTISNAHSLLDFKWTDHILNEMSWLRADTFSWHNGLLYKGAYEHLYEDFISTSTWQHETIGSYTIGFKVAPDGHKITDITSEEAVQNIYNESGVAWYYIIDTTNKRFKLPRTKYGFTGLRDTVGNYVVPGLPNITGQHNGTGSANWTSADASGVFADSYVSGTAGYGSGSYNLYRYIIKLDASDSNPIYGNSTTVQPPATQMYLYFYVGDYSQSQAEQVATLDVEMFNSKADTNMLNLTDAGKNIANWSNNVTNCITEIPQDIKLELNNGTLTLKAGSKVYVPNDVGVFTEIITTQDISRSAFGTDTGDNRYIFPVYSNGAITGLSWGSLTSVSSGTTPPTSGVFYNTSTNYINLYSSGSVTDQRGFPIGMITLSSGTPTSIDQVFNGFGFIGSTIFALPGVKGLIPNGRNTDGTLKNTEFTTTTVLTFTNSTGSATYRDAVIQMDSGSPRLSRNIVAYDEVQNYNHDTTLSGAVIPMIAIAGMQLNNGVISSFDLKTSFHALDYNDKRTIVGWGIPNYSAGVSVANNTEYTATENCLITQQVIGTIASSIWINGIEFRNNTNNTSTAVGWIIPSGTTYKTSANGIFTKYPLKGG